MYTRDVIVFSRNSGRSLALSFDLDDTKVLSIYQGTESDRIALLFDINLRFDNVKITQIRAFFYFFFSSNECVFIDELPSVLFELCVYLTDVLSHD